MMVSPLKSAPDATKSFGSVSVEVQHAIEQFLYSEAECLDDRRFDAWLAMLADDLTYFMPVRSTRNEREMDREYTKEGSTAYFDESKKSLAFRFKKMSTGQSWSETPPSRTRRLISNVRIAMERPDEWRVKSNFLVYRGRLERTVEIFSGERQDVLRRNAEGAFEIAKRLILIDQATLLAANLSIFF